MYIAMGLISDSTVWSYMSKCGSYTRVCARTSIPGVHQLVTAPKPVQSIPGCQKLAVKKQRELKKTLEAHSSSHIVLVV